MNPGRTRGVIWLGWAVVLGACACVDAIAQTTAPAEPAASDLIPHVDPTFGFEMGIPAGWTYDRARFEQPDGAIGLLRGRDLTGTQALQVLIFRDFDVGGFPVWLDGFARRLAETYGASQVTENRWLSEPGARAVLVVDGSVGGWRTQTHYLCIPFDANTVWVLSLAGILSGPADGPRVQARFDEIAASVRVLYSPLEVEKAAAAFERGLAVLQELRAQMTGVQDAAAAGGTGVSPVDAGRPDAAHDVSWTEGIDGTDRYYDMVLAGKSIGYLTRSIWREPRPGEQDGRSKPERAGLRVREESWLFAEDGTVRHTELNMFSSLGLRSELIEQRTTQIPAPDVASQRLYIELDQCVREGNTLFSSFSTNVDLDLRDPRPPIPIGPRYLDLAWVRLLPKLLLKAPAETHAFAMYDCQTRALMIYLIRPLGPCEISGRPGQSGYAFEIREGFVVAPSRLYVDASGLMVRLESGDLVLTQVTRETIERNYAQRREPARQRMQPAASRPNPPG